MSRLAIATLAMGVFTVGAASGLIFAAFATPSRANIESERDAAVASVKIVRSELAAEKVKLVILEAKVEHVDAARKEVGAQWILVLALLEMSFNDPVIRSVLSSPDFEAKFDRPWYMPGMAHDYVGSMWFFKDLADAGLITHDDIYVSQVGYVKARANSKRKR